MSRQAQRERFRVGLTEPVPIPSPVCHGIAPLCHGTATVASEFGHERRLRPRGASGSPS